MTNEEKARHIADSIQEFLEEHPKECKGYTHQLECTIRMFDVIGDRFARRERKIA